MPGELWIVFNANRALLGKLAALSAKPLLTIVKKKQRLPGIFTALHTFGRDLKRNVHIHLSITLGGLCLDGASFKPLYFPKQKVMSMWRHEIIRLLRLSMTHWSYLCPSNSSAWMQKHGISGWIPTIARTGWYILPNPILTVTPLSIWSAISNDPL